MFEFASHGFAVISALTLGGIAVASAGVALMAFIGLLFDFFDDTGSKFVLLFFAAVFFLGSLIIIAEIDCNTDVWPYHALRDGSDGRCVPQEGMR